MTKAVQTRRLACPCHFIKSVCQAWGYWCSQKSWLRDDTMYCRDLRSWLLGDTLFCCFACPTPHIRNSLGRVHETLPHPRAAPVQHHKTIPSTSPPALCQKYLWHLQETVCYLYWAESERNRICPWQGKDKLRNVYKFAKHLMLETRTASSLSRLILHV